MSLSPGRQSCRARSILRNRPTPSPYGRKDSWTDFLRENAVTSLPPIELINRFRLSTEREASSLRKPRLSMLKRPLIPREIPILPLSPHIRPLPMRKLRENSSPCPEVAHCITRKALKPLRRLQIDSLSPRAAEINRTGQSFSFVSPVLEPITTVQSHLRHW